MTNVSELPHERLARIVRGQAAERRVTNTELARLLGITPTSMSRKMSGKVPLTVNEACTVLHYLKVSCHDVIDMATSRRT